MPDDNSKSERMEFALGRKRRQHVRWDEMRWDEMRWDSRPGEYTLADHGAAWGRTRQHLFRGRCQWSCVHKLSGLFHMQIAASLSAFFFLFSLSSLEDDKAYSFTKVGRPTWTDRQMAGWACCCSNNEHWIFLPEMPRLGGGSLAMISKIPLRRRGRKSMRVWMRRKGLGGVNRWNCVGNNSFLRSIAESQEWVISESEALNILRLVFACFSIWKELSGEYATNFP